MMSVRWLHRLRSSAGLRLAVALLFICGQAVLLAHGARHLDGGEAADVCLVCLAGHNVDTPGPAAGAPALPPAVARFALPLAAATAAPAVAAVRLTARGPPAA
jgi:hypothetical protein